MRLIYLVLAMVLFAFCGPQKTGNPHVEIQTKLGDIEVELYPAQAPKSVAAFLTYVDREYYKNGTFYRVLNSNNQPSYAPKAELIQGGMYRTKNNQRDTLPGIPHESTDQTKILHKDGTLSLARLAPGSATTEFFICVGDQPGFDYGGENNPDKQGYAAFGKVIKGMDIVRQIFSRPETDQYFNTPIPIYNIVRQ